MENEIRKIIIGFMQGLPKNFLGFSTMDTADVPQLARVLAKWVQKGVEWEGEAVVQHSYLDHDYSCPLTLVTMPDGEFEIAHHHKGVDGECVTVTVRRETNNDTE